jgi:purine-binding chemotaxis protein CheW
MNKTRLSPRKETRTQGDKETRSEDLGSPCLADSMSPSSLPSPDRAKAIMDERARLLARVPAAKPRAAEMLEIATLKLADERYAVEARHVREVLRSGELTPVPGAPEFLVGLVNLRGEILAVVDLRRFLGLGGAELTDRSRIIVLGHQRAEFGVLADEVHEVTTVPIDEVLAPAAPTLALPEVGEGRVGGREFLRGVTKDALIILDGARLLKESGLFIDQSDPGGL